MSASRTDLVLVALALTHVVLIVGLLATWDALGALAVVAFGVAHALLICTNYQCVAHNFIHTPFFRADAANTAFSLVNSVCLGMPQTLYRAQHLNHHRFSNDPVGDDGSTRDWSSLYRHGRQGEPEGAVAYAVLSLVRTDFGAMYADVARKGGSRLVIAEAALLVALLGAALALAPLAAVGVLAVTTVAGQMLAFLENYAEHYGTTAGDRMRDSVSCYSRLYNLVWFNNGYHQEHHRYPTVHWTQIPACRERMVDPATRTIVTGSHLQGLVALKWAHRRR